MSLDDYFSKNDLICVDNEVESAYERWIRSNWPDVQKKFHDLERTLRTHSQSCRFLNEWSINGQIYRMMLYGEYLFVLNSLQLLPLSELNDLITKMLNVLWNENFLTRQYNAFLKNLNENHSITDVSRIWHAYIKCNKGLLTDPHVIESVTFDHRFQLYETAISSDVTCSAVHHFSAIDFGSFIFYWKWLNNEVRDENLLKLFLIQLTVNGVLGQFQFSCISVKPSLVNDANEIIKLFETKIIQILKEEEKNLSLYSLPESPISLMTEKTVHDVIDEDSFRSNCEAKKKDSFKTTKRKSHKKRKNSWPTSKSKRRNVWKGNNDSFDFNEVQDIDDIMNDPRFGTKYDVCHMDPFDVIVFNGFNKPKDRLFMMIFPYEDIYHLHFVDNGEAKLRMNYESPSGIYPFISAPNIRNQIFKEILNPEISLSKEEVMERRQRQRRKMIAEKEFSKNFHILLKKDLLLN